MHPQALRLPHMGFPLFIKIFKLNSFPHPVRPFYFPLPILKTIDQPLSVSVLGMLDNLAGRAGFYNLALAHHRDFIAKPG